MSLTRLFWLIRSVPKPLRSLLHTLLTQVLRNENPRTALEEAVKITAVQRATDELLRRMSPK